MLFPPPDITAIIYLYVSHNDCASLAGRIKAVDHIDDANYRKNTNLVKTATPARSDVQALVILFYILTFIFNAISDLFLDHNLSRFNGFCAFHSGIILLVFPCEIFRRCIFPFFNYSFCFQKVFLCNSN